MKRECNGCGKTKEHVDPYTGLCPECTSKQRKKDADMGGWHRCSLNKDQDGNPQFVRWPKSQCACSLEN